MENEIKNSLMEIEKQNVIGEKWKSKFINENQNWKMKNEKSLVKNDQLLFINGKWIVKKYSKRLLNEKNTETK